MAQTIKARILNLTLPLGYVKSSDIKLFINTNKYTQNKLSELIKDGLLKRIIRKQTINSITYPVNALCITKKGIEYLLNNAKLSDTETTSQHAKQIKLYQSILNAYPQNHTLSTSTCKTTTSIETGLNAQQIILMCDKAGIGTSRTRSYPLYQYLLDVEPTITDTSSFITMYEYAKQNNEIPMEKRREALTKTSSQFFSVKELQLCDSLTHGEAQQYNYSGASGALIFNKTGEFANIYIVFSAKRRKFQFLDYGLKRYGLRIAGQMRRMGYEINPNRGVRDSIIFVKDSKEFCKSVLCLKNDDELTIENTILKNPYIMLKDENGIQQLSILKASHKHGMTYQDFFNRSYQKAISDLTTNNPDFSFDFREPYRGEPLCNILPFDINTICQLYHSKEKQTIVCFEFEKRFLEEIPEMQKHNFCVIRKKTPK